MSRRHMTREGYEKLYNELEVLKKQRRPLSEQIRKARELGDISENAEYHAAKEKQSHLERKIAEVESSLTQVEIFDASQIDTSRAYLCATVTLQDLTTQTVEVYTLVGANEADPKEGKISVESPIGKGLLGHSVGDRIEIRVPAGILQYRVEKIER